jgi:hypothetical protein
MGPIQADAIPENGLYILFGFLGAVAVLLLIGLILLLRNYFSGKSS